MEFILSPKRLLFLGIILGVILLTLIVIYGGVWYGLLFSFTPLIIFLLIKATGSPTETFMGVFVINYFLIGINRYMPDLQAGIILDGLLTVTFIILISKSLHQKVEWKNGATILSLVSLIWLIYCVFEIFNPNGVLTAWARSIRGIAVYFFLISFLTPIFISRFIDFKRILFILSILTIIGAGKAIYQKFIGFDDAEFRWLYIDGGYITHMLHYGTRYFSIYSDAGNFGAAMGFAFVLFSFTSLQAKSWQKFYYIGVALLSAYGMLLSGTRGAFFIPIVGFALGIILLQHYLKIVIGLITFGLFVGILFFSSLGESNVYIRRMRSAFNKDDASLNVRMKNQKLLLEIMDDLPFGAGIGMSGGKAKDYAPDARISQIPTDSWYVQLWVETGIVGFILYFSIQIFIIFYGVYIILCKLKTTVMKGYMTALVSALFGMLVAAYGNEIWGQLPNIFILTACQAFLFTSPKYDRELIEKGICKVK